MTKNTTPLSVKGRNGWRFVLRDPGQTVRLADYDPVNVSRAWRGSGPHYKGISRYDGDALKNKRNQILRTALKELHAGRFIYGDVFIRLCEEHGVKLILRVYYKCLYMNELDVSIKVIRHKNSRGDFGRGKFDGIFAAIQELIAKTL